MDNLRTKLRNFAVIAVLTLTLTTAPLWAAGTVFLGTVKSASKTVTTAGTPVVLASASTRAWWVVIQAKVGNTGKIYIGGSSAIAGGGQGYTLYSPGDSLVLWYAGNSPVFDLNTLWMDSAVNGEGVDILYLSQ